jgi:hypothetical protein
MFYSIDRFEENFAVLISDEDGSSITVPREHIPIEAEEGGLLSFTEGQYTYDPEETSRRRKRLFMLTKKLSEK